MTTLRRTGNRDESSSEAATCLDREQLLRTASAREQEAAAWEAWSGLSSGLPCSRRGGGRNQSRGQGGGALLAQQSEERKERQLVGGDGGEDEGGKWETQREGEEERVRSHRGTCVCFEGG